MSFPERAHAWLDAGVAVPEPDGKRVSVETPGPYDILAVISTQLSALLEVQQSILAALGSSSDSRSSVKVETGAKRELKATTHVYAGDTDQAANTWLVEEACRLHSLAQQYCDDGAAT